MLRIPPNERLRLPIIAARPAAPAEAGGWAKLNEKMLIHPVRVERSRDTIGLRSRVSTSAFRLKFILSARLRAVEGLDTNGSLEAMVLDGQLTGGAHV
ncbi:hypothetical protein M2346_000793 [Sphingobium xanthum]|nr:hypothetical protein [Sphingobium sp. B10D3B]MCW2400773.1 hypothetical protein [Sphingobium sp. B10D7B]MCW2407752.1 hypothetical protein [Sphingobium xanthum]